MKKAKNSANFLDKKTCDTVMQDLSTCIDDWDRQDLDTTAAVLTVLKFTIDMVFKFTDDSYEAMELISTVINENLDINSIEDLEFLLRSPRISEKKVIH
jgi:hypothetical protein